MIHPDNTEIRGYGEADRSEKSLGIQSVASAWIVRHRHLRVPDFLDKSIESDASGITRASLASCQGAKTRVEIVLRYGSAVIDLHDPLAQKS